MTNPLPKFLAIAGVMLLIAPVPVQAICKAPTQISGIWYGNDGGSIYRVRRIGDTIWWVGMSKGDNGKRWTHVFKGTRNGNIITGEWADVRGNWFSGSLTLRLTRFDHMEKIAETGFPFGAKRWGRGGCPDTEGHPA